MGSRKTGDGAERVYQAASTWVERALRSDDSLFTPGEPIWSRRWLGELRERFLDKPEELKGTFVQKLRQQLAGSPPEVYQLMGEVLYVHTLTLVKVGNKQQRVQEVLGWSPAPVEIPPELIAGLKTGFINQGIGNVLIRFQLGSLIEYIEQWKEQEPSERSRLLDDPWAFKDFLVARRFRSLLLANSQNRGRMQREALLHTVFPDTFETITFVDHKRFVAEAKAFARFVADQTTDVDRVIQQIRQGIEAEKGKDFDFYDDDVVSKWRGPAQPDPWDDFVRRAREYVDTGKLESDEIEYKVEIGRKLAAAREAVLAGTDGWSSLVKKGIASNLIYHISQVKFRDWVDRFPDEVQRALKEIWTANDLSGSERVRAFCHSLPQSANSGAGTRMNIASVLLMGLDVKQYPPFKVTVFKKAYERTGYDQPGQGADEAALYEHALGFLDRFIEEARTRGLTLRHRLDAQSLVWSTLAQKEEEEEEGEGIPTGNGVLAPSHTDPWSPPKVAALAKELLWEPDHLQKIVDGLKDKRQVILQGPPGTGKTYVAKRIAEWCRKHGGGFQIVQFHPSYSYEDFVEGFRPTLAGGQAGFKLAEGPCGASRGRPRPNRTPPSFS